MKELSGIELRDATAADYLSASKRLGGSLTLEQAQKLAMADLELVDRAEAMGDLSGGPGAHKESQVVEPTYEPEQAAVLAENIGGRFERRSADAPDTSAPLLMSADELRKEVGEKAFAMLKRIKHIMVRVAGPVRDPSKIEWAHPALAMEMVRIHADFTFGTKGYMGLKKKEKQRKFWADVMNLCDRSTGEMGPWWVK